jgi:hypothetical protein
VSSEKFAEDRVSKQAWLANWQHPDLVYLENKIKAVTGLCLKSAEEWQVE